MARLNVAYENPMVFDHLLKRAALAWGKSLSDVIREYFPQASGEGHKALEIGTGHANHEG